MVLDIRRRPLVTVDLVIFACLNFWGFSRSLEFANFNFSSVALLL